MPHAYEYFSYYPGAKLKVKKEGYDEYTVVDNTSSSYRYSRMWLYLIPVLDISVEHMQQLFALLVQYWLSKDKNSVRVIQHRIHRTTSSVEYHASVDGQYFRMTVTKFGVLLQDSEMKQLLVPQFEVTRMLTSWHYDVFDLITRGAAIDMANYPAQLAHV